MVSVHITDSSSVTAGAVTVTGPLSFDAASVTVGTETFSNGVVLVTLGSAERVMPFHPQEAAQIPLGIALLFVLGLIWARHVTHR